MQATWNIATDTRSLVVYIDVAESLWWDSAPEDRRRRIDVIAANTAGIRMVLVGGSTDVTTDKLARAIDDLRHGGLETTPIGSFTLDPSKTPRSADFAAVPIFLNRSTKIGAFDVFLSSIEALEANRIPVLTYGYLLFRPAETTTVGRVLGTATVDPLDECEVERFAALAQHLGLHVLGLEAGSGAVPPLSPKAVASVRRRFDGMIVAGGGVHDRHLARDLIRAGADAVNVGNALEVAASLERVLVDLIAGTAAAGRPSR